MKKNQTEKTDNEHNYEKRIKELEKQVEFCYLFIRFQKFDHELKKGMDKIKQGIDKLEKHVETMS